MNNDINKYLMGNNYPMNDLKSTFTHYDPKTGKNVPTENILKEDNKKYGSEN